MNGVSITVHDELTGQTQILTTPCLSGRRLAQIVTATAALLGPGQQIVSIDVA